MSCLSVAAMKEPLVDNCNGDYINSNEYKILDLDLVKMKKEDVEFASQYELKFKMNDQVQAIVAWFDCIFSDLENPVTLTTSPYDPSTHWKQTVFYLDHDLTVKQGDVLKGSIAVRKSRANFRELDVKISYHMDTPQCKQDHVQMYKLK